MTAMGKRVIVNDRMQSGYAYWRTEPVGRNFAPEFTPDLTPKEMLRLGIFGGKHMTDCHEEFPRSWRFRPEGPRARTTNAHLFDVEGRLIRPANNAASARTTPALLKGARFQQATQEISQRWGEVLPYGLS